MGRIVGSSVSCGRLADIRPRMLETGSVGGVMDFDVSVAPKRSEGRPKHRPAADPGRRGRYLERLDAATENDSRPEWHSCHGQTTLERHMHRTSKCLTNNTAAVPFYSSQQMKYKYIIFALLIFVFQAGCFSKNESLVEKDGPNQLTSADLENVVSVFIDADHSPYMDSSMHFDGWVVAHNGQRFVTDTWHGGRITQEELRRSIYFDNKQGKKWIVLRCKADVRTDDLQYSVVAISKLYANLKMNGQLYIVIDIERG